MAWLLTLAAAACGGGDPGGAGDGGGPDGDGTGPCSMLTMYQCRARADCVSDECIECACTPVFEGCREPSAPEMCPDLECLDPPCCRAEADCTTTPGPCAPPGTPSGCGICNPDPGTCSMDDECSPTTTGMICQPIQCSCSGASQCSPGCDTTGCGIGLVCGATSERCEPQPCVDDPDCPPNFSCVAPGPTVPHCVRTSCAADGDCDGWCVLGVCYESLGECTPPVP